jgi:hypothetical protein
VTRAERIFLHLSTILVGGTGLVYAWMIYLVRPSDPYAVVNHPLQPQVLHLHILFAPLVVFAAGVVWRRHIWSHWRRGVRRGRRSGASMVLTLVPMVVSGYLIQTAVEDTWRRTWVVVHLVTSGLWLLGYLAHQIPNVLDWWRKRARTQKGPAPIALEPGTSGIRPATGGLRLSPGTRSPRAVAGATPAGAGPPGDR